MHLEEVFRCGLAGTCVFSYTDEWFTGGHPITDWAFGLVRRDRSPKPAFHRVAESFRAQSPLPALSRYPKVSVVVCTYNGSKTLDGCLRSLQKLNYPDYEVILVNDGSTDSVPEIAARYPYIRYHEQPNRGLSVARNVGMDLARGEIIAYTDDDCFADPDWLYFLVAKLLETDASGVGGPNLLPTNDGPVAACVSASPGTPAHVLIDDNVAEHVPGCNMAFWADRLRAIGGFDAVYTKAGDDVDVCWRLQAEGEKIAYAPAAMVWHHRRATVAAYLKQQRGYGEAEGLLKRKHPEKFRGFRARPELARPHLHARRASASTSGSPIVHHGVFGAGMFQTVYARAPGLVAAARPEPRVVGARLPDARAGPRLEPARPPRAERDPRAPGPSRRSRTPSSSCPCSCSRRPRASPSSWRARPRRPSISAGGGRGCSSPPCTWPSPWSAAGRATRRASSRSRSRRRCTTCAAPGSAGPRDSCGRASSSSGARTRSTGRPCSRTLLALAARHRWFVRIDSGWETHDVRFYGDRWCKTDLVTVTENHGGGRRLTRARLAPGAHALPEGRAVPERLRGRPRRGGSPRSWRSRCCPFAALFFWHVRASGRRLRSAVMAAVLSVAEAQRHERGGRPRGVPPAVAAGAGRARPRDPGRPRPPRPGARPLLRGRRPAVR